MRLVKAVGKQAGGGGFEPPHTESESAVLPLDEPPEKPARVRFDRCHSTIIPVLDKSRRFSHLAYAFFLRAASDDKSSPAQKRIDEVLLQQPFCQTRKPPDLSYLEIPSGAHSSTRGASARSFTEADDLCTHSVQATLRIGIPGLVQPGRSMNDHYAAAGNRVARHSLYEVGRATLDSYISARRMNPCR
jgi:hypothetical protein